MRLRKFSVALVLFLVCAVVLGANFASFAEDDNEFTQAYPKFGFGAQFISPSGGISARLKLNKTFGIEGNAILWSDPEFGLQGTASLRLLTDLTDNDLVNFYLAAGGAYNFEGSRSETSGYLTAVGTGGVALNILSERFKFNLEFGIAGQALNEFWPAFGSGFHYYF